MSFIEKIGCVNEEKNTGTRRNINNIDEFAREQTSNNLDRDQQKSSRQLCLLCKFPQRTCVCASLPKYSLSPLFQRCRIVVLQHPHELRRSNSSLPLVELCLFGKRLDNETKKSNPDFVMKTVIGRRFGDHCDEDVMNILRDPKEVIVLVFPHDRAVHFEEGLRRAEKRCFDCSEGNTDNSITMNGCKRKKITLIFIDGTWKHAKEMVAATEAAGEWPENMICIQMTPTSNGVTDKSRCRIGENVGGGCSESKEQGNDSESLPFIQRRFLIRSPPSPDHLSTAECIAWIASTVENNPQIYVSITKMVDCMVTLWQGCARSENRKRSCKSEMTQKKLKIRGHCDS